MGDRLGEKLPILNSTTGFYFSFNSMFQGAEIYGEAEASGSIATFQGALQNMSQCNRSSGALVGPALSSALRCQRASLMSYHG